LTVWPKQILRVSYRSPLTIVHPVWFLRVLTGCPCPKYRVLRIVASPVVADIRVARAADTTKQTCSFRRLRNWETGNVPEREVLPTRKGLDRGIDGLMEARAAGANSTPAGGTDLYRSNKCALESAIQPRAMTNKLFRFPFTSAAVVFAVIAVSAALIGHINLIEIVVSIISRIEQHAVDEVVTALLLVIVALVVDTIRAVCRRNRDAQRKAERLRAVHITMRTVQDIVNNCLNQLQLLRVEAEGLVPEGSLRFFDNAIHETTAKLKELGDLKVFAEKQMAIGRGLDVGDPD
jgi:hypothetical protein